MPPRGLPAPRWAAFFGVFLLGALPAALNAQNVLSWRQTALHILLSPPGPTHTRSLKSVEVMLALGADVHARDKNGATPLKALIPCRNPEIGEEELRIIDALANAGADLNLPDNTGTTPLACAIQTAHFAATARLIALGAELNPVLPGGENYVHSAARLKMEKAEALHILQALIVAGVDFDTADDRGRTPLHIAALNGNSAAVRLLLQYGADRQRRDKAGRRPIDLVACPTEGGCSPQAQELAVILSASPSVLPQFTPVGEISTLAGTEVEISGITVRPLSVGERLVVRTASGDYSMVAGQLQGSRRRAKVSPAAARRVVPKDRVYRKESGGRTSRRAKYR